MNRLVYPCETKEKPNISSDLFIQLTWCMPITYQSSVEMVENSLAGFEISVSSSKICPRLSIVSLKSVDKMKEWNIQLTLGYRIHRKPVRFAQICRLHQGNRHDIGPRYLHSRIPWPIDQLWVKHISYTPSCQQTAPKFHCWRLECVAKRKLQQPKTMRQLGISFY